MGVCWLHLETRAKHLLVDKVNARKGHADVSQASLSDVAVSYLEL